MGRFFVQLFSHYTEWLKISVTFYMDQTYISRKGEYVITTASFSALTIVLVLPKGVASRKPLRRWAGKASHVRLAPEYVFTTKHPRRTE